MISQLQELLRERPAYVDTLRQIVEREGRGFDQRLGWTWKDLKINPGHLATLLRLGVLRGLYHSHSYKGYRLEDREAVKEALGTFSQEQIPLPNSAKIEIPDDLFAPLVRLDDIKEIIVKSLKGEKPVHILLIAPPATAAKSTILSELERIPGATYISIGGAATRVGLRDVLAEAPLILLLDEIDKVAGPLDLSALMTWMESGRVTIARHNDRRDIRGKGWVIAAANSKRGIAPELLSRFVVLNIPPYTRDDYIEVVKRVLVMREGADPELAGYIADRLAADGSRDVRDAIQLARLAKTKEEVIKFLDIMRRYQ